MKRCLAIALLAIAAVAPATAQITFCGSKAILPDDQHFVPGLKFTEAPGYTGYALVSVYLSPDGVYDKPVVIPTPFDATEQTNDPVTPSKLFEEFSPFIVRIKELGYDVLLVHTQSGQNIHEQAAEFAQAVQWGASKSPNGKVIIAAY